MYVCMHACMHICMYVYMYVYMHVCMQVFWICFMKNWGQSLCESSKIYSEGDLRTRNYAVALFM